MSDIKYDSFLYGSPSLTEAPIAKSTVDKMRGKIPEEEVDIPG